MNITKKTMRFSKELELESLESESSVIILLNLDVMLNSKKRF